MPEIIDTRVFRNGLRVDGDPNPFVIRPFPSVMVKGETPEAARELYQRERDAGRPYPPLDA